MENVEQDDNFSESDSEGEGLPEIEVMLKN